MVAPRWRKVARDLVAHKTRTALVVASIAVGILAVAMIAGGRAVLTRAMDTSFPAAVPPHAVIAVDGADEHVVAAVRRYPGVADAQGRRGAGVRYRTASDSEVRNLGLVAVTDPEDIRIGKVDPQPGAHWPPRVDEVVLERSARQLVDLDIGDVLLVEGRDGRERELRVGGFVHDPNAVPAPFAGRASGYVSFDTVRRLGMPEDLNQIDIVVGDPTPTKESVTALATRLRDEVVEPRGVRVVRMRVPEPGSHPLGDPFKAISTLLLVLGGLALVLSGFLVVNTVSALVAQQVRHVGVMKAVGARTTQVIAMYMVAVTAFGVLALAVGWPSGTALGVWFTNYVAGLLNLEVTDYAAPWYVTLLSLAVGIVMPIAAAALPVVQGVRGSVREALSPRGVTTAEFGEGLVDKLLERVRGLSRPLVLSLRNTFLRKGRLALTLTTLALASAVFCAVMNVRSSMGATTQALFEFWDYDVYAALAEPQPSRAIERLVLRVPGVKAFDAFSEYEGVYLRSDGTENEAVTVRATNPGRSFLKETVTLGRAIRDGDTDAIVVNSDFTHDEPDVGIGSRVRLKVEGEEAEFRVVGVTRGQLEGAVVQVHPDALNALAHREGTAQHLMLRTAEHDVDAQLRVGQAVEERLGEAGYVVSFTQAQTRSRERVAWQFDIIIVFLMIMAVLLAVVGAIGLAGTMSINVLESTREIGVMRAIGADNGAVYRIFITEGVVVGVMAWAIGAVASLPVTALLRDVLEGALKLELADRLSAEGFALWLAIVVVISVLASLLPAYRAAQVSVRDAISYE